MEHGCWLFYIKLVRFQCLKMNVRREKPAALLRSNRIRPEVTHVQTDGYWAARPPQTTDLVWNFWVIQVKPCLKTRFSRLLANCRPFLIIEYFNLAWNVILSHYGDSRDRQTWSLPLCAALTVSGRRSVPPPAAVWPPGRSVFTHGSCLISNC